MSSWDSYDNDLLFSYPESKTSEPVWVTHERNGYRFIEVSEIERANIYGCLQGWVRLPYTRERPLFVKISLVSAEDGGSTTDPLHLLHPHMLHLYTGKIGDMSRPQILLHEVSWSHVLKIGNDEEVFRLESNAEAIGTLGKINKGQLKLPLVLKYTRLAARVNENCLDLGLGIDGRDGLKLNIVTPLINEAAGYDRRRRDQRQVRLLAESFDANGWHFESKYSNVI